MAIKNKHLYKREITHKDYLGDSNAIRNNGGSGLLDFRITENKINFKQSSLEKKIMFIDLDDNFMKQETTEFVLPQTLGGVFLFFFLSFFYVAFFTGKPDEPIPFYFYAVMSLSILGIIFLTYYYFTMPKKECVFNREDGLLTIPGLMWKANTTMPFTKAMFTYTGPSAQGLGAYKLQVMRPDKFYSKYLISMGRTCYEDLSFLVWFMDKNRPLPPGTAFDPYREKDFERRKSEGFSKPLFPATFDTPEATQEQQAQRLKIGGW